MVVISHANVRSLVADGRLLNVSSLVSFNNVDIFCLSETWLKPKHLSSSLLIPGFQPPLRCDHLANRGGVLLYIFVTVSPSRSFASFLLALSVLLWMSSYLAARD